MKRVQRRHHKNPHRRQNLLNSHFRCSDGEPIILYMGQPTQDRRRPFSLSEQLHLIIPLLAVWGVGLLILSAVAAQGNAGQLLLDPTYAAGAAWYTGFVASLGILAWGVAAGAAGWCSWTARIAGRNGAATFLRGGAVVTSALLLDDLFDFHAGLLPMVGIPKLAGESIFVAGVAYWVVTNWREVQRTRVQLLGAALLASAASIIIDIALNPSPNNRGLLFEDGAKFLGILAWSTYFVVTARDIGRSVMRQVSETGVVDRSLVAAKRPGLSDLTGAPTGRIASPVSVG